MSEYLPAPSTSAAPAARGPMPVDTLAPPVEPTVDPRRLMAVLVRRRWQILGVCLLAVIPVAVSSYLTPSLYRSTTLVEVNPEPAQVLPYRDVTSPASANALYYMTTQEQALRGPGLMLRVSKRLAASPDAALAAESSRLAGRLRIEQVPNSEVFRISYQAPRPETAAQVANTFAEEYIASHFESQQDTRRKARDVLQRELALLERQVQQSEQQLVEYSQSHDMHWVDAAETDVAQQQLASLSKQLLDADAAAVAAQVRLATLKAATVQSFPDKLMTPVLSERMSALMQLEHDLTALRTSFGENWPAVVQKRREVELVQQQLEREKRQAIAQAVDQATLDARAAGEQRRLLSISKAEQERVVNTLQDASIQYNIIRREVDTNRKLYEGVLERLKETAITSSTAFGNIHVLEPAVPDKSAASPNVAWNLALALLLGLSLGVCVALVGDFWRNPVSTVEDAEYATGLPVLAVMPLVAARRRRALPEGEAGGPGALRLGTHAPPNAANAPTTMEGAEAVRSLCASILLSRAERPPRVIVVTSAVSGEGKTTVAMQLGRALAETGGRTLLIECDMRRPSVARHFGLSEAGGLSLFLSGHTAQPTLHRIEGSELCVVSAGPVAPNPVALLNSDRMARFLADAAAEFRFVIVDTPPALSIADARIVSARADGVVIVTRANDTPQHIVRRALAVLRGSGAPLLGTVLNAAPLTGLERSYYRYYAESSAEP